MMKSVSEMSKLFARQLQKEICKTTRSGPGNRNCLTKETEGFHAHDCASQRIFQHIHLHCSLIARQRIDSFHPPYRSKYEAW